MIIIIHLVKEKDVRMNCVDNGIRFEIDSLLEKYVIQACPVV